MGKGHGRRDAGFRENNTRDIVDLPKDKEPVGYKWVFTVKLKPDGNVS